MVALFYFHFPSLLNSTFEKGSSFDYAWTDSEFQPGDEVYLVSLYADMDLNGQEGVVIGAADETGKCLIRLHASGEQVCVFEKNLSHIENKVPLIFLHL